MWVGQPCGACTGSLLDRVQLCLIVAAAGALLSNPLVQLAWAAVRMTERETREPPQLPIIPSRPSIRKWRRVIQGYLSGGNGRMSRPDVPSDPASDS